jgi:siroheme synthase-like protein
MTSYPLFLTDLHRQRAVVVGAGPTAERKVEGLLDTGARVTLIDPAPGDPLREWGEHGRLEWVDRSYRDGDLEGAVLVIVTEATPETKEQVWQEAQRRNVLINTTGEDHRSTFANGAAVRRGPLVVSVSTSGAAPALSVRLREQLEATFGPEYEELLSIMNALREPMQAQISDFSERRSRWYALVDSDGVELLRSERRAAGGKRVESIGGTEVVGSMEDCRGEVLDSPVQQA